jgi:hypothetical protein
MSARTSAARWSDARLMSALDPSAVCELIDAHVKRVLDLAELAIATDKFERFRTLVLDEFGHKGLRGELAALSRGHGMERQGMGRSDTGKEGGPR